jgi:hypothetical protein
MGETCGFTIALGIIRIFAGLSRGLPYIQKLVTTGFQMSDKSLKPQNYMLFTRFVKGVFDLFGKVPPDRFELSF